MPGCYIWTRCLIGSAMISLILGSAASGADTRKFDLTFHQGETMQSARVFLIYWLPPGFKLDSSIPNGVGNFPSLSQAFVHDLSPTSYFNILTQYPGICGANQCVIRNGSGVAGVAGMWIDTQTYPNNRGTKTNPLQNSDVRQEIQRAIGQNHWSPGMDAQFFVFTGEGVEECNNTPYCTFNGYCAYHSHFGQGTSTVIYSYMSSISSNSSGCSTGIARPLVLMSHEFFESVTNPLETGWYNDLSNNEIGDDCNGQEVVVTLANVHPYKVQEQWSNHSASCVSSY